MRVFTVQHQARNQTRRNFLGRIDSSRDSRIRFEFGGKVNGVHFDEGQVVQQGDILAMLDTEIWTPNSNSPR